MNAQQLLYVSIAHRREKYFAEQKRCRSEFSEAAVHDLRVAARRLLALIDLLRELAPHPEFKKLRRALKDQLDSLDDLRDVQVMLAEISESIESLPDLAPIQKFLETREKQLLNDARRGVRGFWTRSIQKKLISAMIKIGLPGFALDLKARIFHVIDDSRAAVIQRIGQIHPDVPSSIHRVRVAFKKFRYMIEIIHPLLDHFPETHLKDMHDYQSRMGDIQDVEILLRQIDEYAAREHLYDPQVVRSTYERRRADLIHAYLGTFNEIIIFWRETPESPFPWESKGSQYESLPDAPRRLGRTGRSDRRQPASVKRQGKTKVEGDQPQPGKVRSDL